MSDDLVKRLRYRLDGGYVLVNLDGPEAADRIEQLERDLAAWRGVHEGAVLAMQARIKQLEEELEWEKEFRKVAAKKAWEFADRIEQLEAALDELSDGHECCPVSQAMRRTARATLEEKKDV